MSWVFWKFTEFGVCSVTSRCPPDYSVTDKMAPHKFLFWPRVQVNHAPGQGATGPVTCPGPGHLVFSSNILVMALFRVQGWHRLDGCPELHLMVSLEFPYLLEVLGNISKLCWLHLICDGSLGSLTIDHLSFSPRQQYSMTLCFFQSTPVCSIFPKYIQIFFGWLNILR